MKKKLYISLLLFCSILTINTFSKSNTLIINDSIDDSKSKIIKKYSAMGFDVKEKRYGLYINGPGYLDARLNFNNINNHRTEVSYKTAFFHGKKNNEYMRSLYSLEPINNSNKKNIPISKVKFTTLSLLNLGLGGNYLTKVSPHYSKTPIPDTLINIILGVDDILMLQRILSAPYLSSDIPIYIVSKALFILPGNSFITFEQNFYKAGYTFEY
jgi:hypothetical protein